MNTMKSILIAGTVLLAACQDQPKQAIETTASDSLSIVSPPEKQVATSVDTSFVEDSIFADGSIPTSWEVAGITDPRAFRHFVERFQGWVAKGQADSIADHTRFPLRIAKSRKVFLENYNKIFTDPVKAAIAGQNLKQIFRRDQGAMLGQGEVWIGQKEQDTVAFEITAINPKQ